MLAQDRSKRNVIKTAKRHNDVWKAREEAVENGLFLRGSRRVVKNPLDLLLNNSLRKMNTGFLLRWDKIGVVYKTAEMLY